MSAAAALFLFLFLFVRRFPARASGGRPRSAMHRARDHLVDLRPEGVSVDREQHARAHRDALGAECLNQWPIMPTSPSPARSWGPTPKPSPTASRRRCSREDPTQPSAPARGGHLELQYAHAAIENQGAIVVSKKRLTLPRGTRIPTAKTKIVRPE